MACEASMLSLTPALPAATSSRNTPERACRRLSTSVTSAFCRRRVRKDSGSASVWSPDFWMCITPRA